MPSRPLLFLYRLARVHQEDRSSSLTCYPRAHSERAIQVHTQNVPSKCTLRTCYPSAHSERAIQLHTQNVPVYVCLDLVPRHGEMQVGVLDVKKKSKLKLKKGSEGEGTIRGHQMWRTQSVWPLDGGYVKKL